MMITKLACVLTREDYIAVEKARAKSMPAMKLTYIATIVWLAFAVYDYKTNKSLIMLGGVVIFLLSMLFVTFFMTSVKPKHTVDKMLKLDSSYLKPREFIISDKYIEINSISVMGEPVLNAVYPYSVMGAIMESKDYYQFIMTTEAYILPKRAIPEDKREAVHNAVASNPKYILLKNI